MITIKSKRELQGMQKSGRVLAAMFEGLRDVIKPGISTWEIEEFAQDFIYFSIPITSTLNMVGVFQNKVLKDISMELVLV